VSDRGLVVHQASLTEMEEAMTSATSAIADHLTTTLDQVNTQTAAWTEETPSRQAQREYERRLREGITQLTQALDDIKAAVAAYRDDARETEVENVAIVG
jgi:chromosome segregation ATPase